LRIHDSNAFPLNARLRIEATTNLFDPNVEQTF
jgi:hypothetical protein